MKDSGKGTDHNTYDDILNVPHHQSAVHPHMLRADRAAQFAPFSALAGYEEAISETARLTEEKKELDEDEKALLNGILEGLQEQIENQTEELPCVEICYFRPDERKAGGEYITVTGKIRQIHEYRRCLKLEDGTEIPMETIMKIAQI